MSLRAKKPEAIQKRLKFFMFGTAGVGKTTAAIQFPSPYIIDTERGSENYDKLINAAGGSVFQTNDAYELIAEIKSLLTEQHNFKTLVIDPITPIYNDLLEKAEAKVGSMMGRHYGEANKVMRRFVNLVMQLDMTVVITSHAKTEYGDNLKVLGQTFDAWKKMDYVFDLAIELQKKGKGESSKRIGRVVKTRVAAFPDGDEFPFSYEEFCKRFGAENIERDAKPVQLASPEQVATLKQLLEIVKLPDGTVEKWLAKAGVDDVEDLSADVMAKCLEYVRNRLPAT